MPRRFGQALPFSGSLPWCSPEPKDPQGSCRRQGRTGTGSVATAANQNRKEEQAYTPCCRSGRYSGTAAICKSRPRLRSIPRRRGRTGLFRRYTRTRCLPRLSNSRFRPPSIRRTIRRVYTAERCRRAIGSGRIRRWYAASAPCLPRRQQRFRPPRTAFFRLSAPKGCRCRRKVRQRSRNSFPIPSGRAGYRSRSVACPGGQSAYCPRRLWRTARYSRSARWKRSMQSGTGSPPPPARRRRHRFGRRLP